MKGIIAIAFSSIFTLSVCAQSQSVVPFQEQAPLPMNLPNEGKGQHASWLPISPEAQEGPQKNTAVSGKTINESIKTIIQKRMQSLLQPMDNESEH